MKSSILARALTVFILLLVFVSSAQSWAESATGRGEGLATAGEGLATAGEGLATAGEGLATAGEGLATAGEGLATAGEGLATAGEGLATADEGLAMAGAQPIERLGVEQVMRLGGLTELDGYELQSPAAEAVLERLIVEQIVLEAAAKSHVKVSSEELNEAFADLMPVKSGVVWTDEEQASIKIALEKRLVVRKMTEQVMVENQILSAEGWQKYWAGWPRTKAPRYQVQALLLPLAVDVSKLDLSPFKELESIKDYFIEQGLVVLLSGPMWLAGADQDPALVAALEEAFTAGKPTEARTLTDSWVIYEILTVERDADPLEDYRRARIAFEDSAREKAFHDWLVAKRAQGDMKTGSFVNH